MNRVLCAGGSVLAAWALLIAQPAPESAVIALKQRAAAAVSQISGVVEVPGLDEQVEVLRDRWGVPHIYAKTTHDLFFAQGYVAAQDRLWQLDLWRRNAQGTLSEIVGPSGVKRDTFARLLRYRGDMAAEWASYGSDARRIIESFIEGINSQVTYVNANPEKLPIEFQLIGARPEPWTPEVVIGRMAGYVMTRNARSEVQRARLARRVGVGRVAEFQVVDPPVAIEIPDGLNLEDITDAILDIASDASELVRFPDTLPKVASAAPGFGFEQPVRRLSVGLVLEAAGAPGAAAAAGDAEAMDNWFEDAWRHGSNNWVLSGKLTATGRPILANDPHRILALPSLRYSVHLVGPGWNVIGAGEPALPGVAAGHNDRIAFGFTIVGIDQQDLYVEQLDPLRAGHYLYKGMSEPMRIERETIRVRGEAVPRVIELRFTRHGPVLHVDSARRRAYALRWVGMEPGTAGYLRSLALNQARTWPEFLEAARGWLVPSENLVYADVDGNIGWVAAGMAPIRPGWSGLLPVPGHEGKYEWAGFLRLEDLPQSFNPPSGIIATANHNILPPGYDKALGYEWSAPYRFRRIMDVLSAGAGQPAPGHTVADSERLQHDALSVVARDVCNALRTARAARHLASEPGREGLPPVRARAVEMLAAWDHVVSRNSAAAALYELWFSRLATAAARALVPAADQPLAGSSMSTSRLLAALARAATDPSVQDVLLGPSLDQAWQDAVARMGPDPREWAWGRIHRASWAHPLASSGPLRSVLNLPDVPRGGDGTTPFATGSGARQTSGASFREVVDLADWDRSTTINVPGISGQPGSPFYGNLLNLWADERHHPMLFSRQAVEAHTAARLWLMPAR
ncbi:MAG: penicillin acylase family protein [Acidobacteriota bacterium]